MSLYTPTDDEARVALTVAKIRNSHNGNQTNLPGGETSSTDERLFQHYVACLAEIAVSRITNLCWTGCGKGALGGFDVGNRYEVRSITERSRGLLIRTKDLKKGPNIPYVLVHVDRKSRACTAIGWHRAEDVVKNGRVLDPDSEQPCWILPQVFLLDMGKLL